MLLVAVRRAWAQVHTVAGKRMTGHAVTELVTQGGGYVLLSGLGRLRTKLSAQAA